MLEYSLTAFPRCRHNKFNLGMGRVICHKAYPEDSLPWQDMS